MKSLLVVHGDEGPAGGLGPACSVIAGALDLDAVLPVGAAADVLGLARAISGTVLAVPEMAVERLIHPAAVALAVELTDRPLEPGPALRAAVAISARLEIPLSLIAVHPHVSLPPEAGASVERMANLARTLGVRVARARVHYCPATAEAQAILQAAADARIDLLVAGEPANSDVGDALLAAVVGASRSAVLIVPEPTPGTSGIGAGAPVAEEVR